MPYTDKFIPADNLVAHLTPVVPTIIVNPAISSAYAGFLSVSAVTVYELAIKDIFNDFSKKKHKVFGEFTEKYFLKINGRIKLDDLRGQHIKLFGSKYLTKFDSLLGTKQTATLAASHVSIRDNYNNLITCRHEFVHAGNPTLSITEVIDCYTTGKEVLHVLNNAMKR
jgi:RiboL-PSP-HEPN